MRIILLSFLFMMSAILTAQSPALIPYQAIARNAAGDPLASTTLNVRFTLHDGSATGIVVWQEMQTLTTSTLGLFTAQLGSSVELSGVNWENGNKFMQVEIDQGQGFMDIGTQQLLSVPYALHAGSVRLDVSAIGDTLFVGDGSFVIIPGLSEANSYTTGTTLHTCGTPNIHNPNLTYGTMIDQEGNAYKTIVIGTQEWMAENLNTSIYRNGDPITTGFITAQQGACAYYNNDASFACPYGKLYNWYACVDTRQLCPVGWHVPSYGDWVMLINFLDPNADEWSQTNDAGGKMKSTGTLEAGTGLWHAPNLGATNSSGFSGIPGGYVVTWPGFIFDMGYNGGWKSTTQSEADFSPTRFLHYNLLESYAISSGAGGEVGFGSVRCIKD
jgi:uncharacterized protein (TIGR02145 family)